MLNWWLEQLGLPFVPVWGTKRKCFKKIQLQSHLVFSRGALDCSRKGFKTIRLNSHSRNLYRRLIVNSWTHRTSYWVWSHSYVPTEDLASYCSPLSVFAIIHNIYGLSGDFGVTGSEEHWHCGSSWILGGHDPSLAQHYHLLVDLYCKPWHLFYIHSSILQFSRRFRKGEWGDWLCCSFELLFTKTIPLLLHK